METIIEIPIYFADLIIIQSDNIQKPLSKYNIKFNTHGFGAITFRAPTEEGRHRYVVSFDFDVDLSLIAHEAFHVVTYLFQDKQMRIDNDNDNDEAAAYLLGWIVTQILERIKVDTI